MQQMINDFEMYYRYLKKDVLKYDRSGKYLIVRLKTGESLLYNSITHYVRILPNDSSNMTEEECRSEFGNRLYDILRSKGISQKELSSKVGLSETMISRYMKGIATPSFYIVDKIAKAIGCSTDSFRYTE